MKRFIPSQQACWPRPHKCTASIKRARRPAITGLTAKYVTDLGTMLMFSIVVGGRPRCRHGNQSIQDRRVQRLWRRPNWWASSRIWDTKSKYGATDDMAQAVGVECGKASPTPKHGPAGCAGHHAGRPCAGRHLLPAA